MVGDTFSDVMSLDSERLGRRGDSMNSRSPDPFRNNLKNHVNVVFNSALNSARENRAVSQDLKRRFMQGSIQLQ